VRRLAHHVDLFLVNRCLVSVGTVFLKWWNRLVDSWQGQWRLSGLTMEYLSASMIESLSWSEFGLAWVRNCGVGEGGRALSSTLNVCAPLATPAMDCKGYLSRCNGSMTFGTRKAIAALSTPNNCIDGRCCSITLVLIHTGLSAITWSANFGSNLVCVLPKLQHKLKQWFVTMLQLSRVNSPH